MQSTRQQTTKKHMSSSKKRGSVCPFHKYKFPNGSQQQQQQHDDRKMSLPVSMPSYHLHPHHSHHTHHAAASVPTPQQQQQALPPLVGEDTINSQEEPDFVQDYLESLSHVSTTATELERVKNFQVVLEMICVASMDPVLISDVNGVIKTVNQEFLDMFGYHRWEIIGQNIKVIMTGPYQKVHDQYMKRYQRTKMKRIIGEKRDNIKAVAKDGSEIPIILKVSELVSGSEVAYIAVIKNITYDQELLRIRDMISNMLPEIIADKIQNGEKEIADEVEGSVIFVDLVGFTQYMSNNSAKKVVQDLNFIFKHFDTICEKYYVEKIKTIGDAYMAVCTSSGGMLFDYAVRMMEFGLEVIDFVKKSTQFHVRVGIATGPLIEGVLSGAKLSFDVWGDTVNVASRLQSLASEDSIIVCSRTHKQVNYKYEFAEPVKQEVKGKGLMNTYAVLGRNTKDIL